ncbi:MAG: NUDIX hydrolase [Janthinobacterium lividum]
MAVAAPRPVFARHAASLLIIRETAAGPEVLMGMRGKGHRFMPNRLVFPGGAVDAADGVAPAAAEPSAELLGILGQRAKPRLARGIVLCAARELQEETGLTLGEPPALDRLTYLCRAVTPPTMPMRFNARFLMVPEAAVSGVAGDSHELQEVGFRNVAAVMSAGLAQVTREVLLQFVAWHERSRREPAHSVTRMVYRRQKWVKDH